MDSSLRYIVSIIKSLLNFKKSQLKSMMHGWVSFYQEEQAVAPNNSVSLIISKKGPGFTSQDWQIN